MFIGLKTKRIIQTNLYHFVKARKHFIWRKFACMVAADSFFRCKMKKKNIFKSKYFYIWIFFCTFALKFIVHAYVCVCHARGKQPKMCRALVNKLKGLFMKKNQEPTVVEEEKYPHLLSNHTCGEDLFEGKSHELIAKRIVQTIAEDASVHAIGLDGDWGSGKSNVIEQVRKLSNPQRDLIFVYDAWAYQTDPQKRSILETIIEFLAKQTFSGKNIFKGEEWDEKKKNLLAKRVETDVVETPRWGIGIIIAVLLIVLTPLFEYVAGDIIDGVLWKCLFLSIPLLSLFVVIVYYWYKNRKKEGYGVKKALGDAFSVYSGKKNESTSIETISEAEPSSTQFKDWMSEIDSKLVGYKLVLVFDNIDRLTVEKVRELWSVINALFAEQSYNNIIVIVPFDRKHIQFAFQSEDMQAGANISEHSYGNDFINKTFNVVYRVSPPIMTAWKGFFEEKWKEAFGGPCESKVLQIFEVLTNKITPRKIIAYINRFVSIRQVVDKDIPDEYIALYILGEDKIKEDPYQEIISPSYLGALDFMYQQDEELPKYMAALYFQIAPESALEVAYVDRLRRALDENGQETIKPIAELPSFGKLLNSAIVGVVNVPNATLALESCAEKVETTHWDELLAKIGKHDSSLQEYQKILLQHISKPNEYLQTIVDVFGEEDSFNAVRYYQSIKGLHEIGCVDFRMVKEKQLQVDAFLSYIQEARGDYKLCPFKCDANALDVYLSQREVKEISGLGALRYISKDYGKFEKYRAHLEELINKNVTDIDVVSMCYQRLKDVETKPLEETLSDIDITVLFQGSKSEHSFYYDLVSMRLARLGSFTKAQASAFAPMISKTDDDTVEKVAHVIENYMDYGTILLALPECAEEYPLLKAVAQYLTKRKVGLSRMNIISVLTQYDKVKAALGVDSDALLARLNGWIEFAKFTTENTQKLPYQFFADAYEVKCDLTKKAVEMYLDYMKSIEEENWVGLLTNSSKEYRMLILYKPKIRNAFEAFKRLLTDVANGAIVMSQERVAEISDWAKRHYSLGTAFKGMRDRFINGAEMTPQLFTIYGEYLFEHAKLEEKKDSLRTIFTDDVLESTECLNIVLRHQDAMMLIVEKAGEDAQDFKEKMATLWQGEYSESTPEGFVEFMVKIGVEKPQVNQETKDAETESQEG